MNTNNLSLMNNCNNNNKISFSDLNSKDYKIKLSKILSNYKKFEN